MALDSVSLTASARANLSALTSTAALLGKTQTALSTGKSVNSATDNAVAFFASQGFLNRANQLSNVKDNLSTALQTVNSITASITDINTVVVQLQGVTTQALGTDTTVRLGLATQFNSLLTQLNELVNDATFNGTNLLNSTSTSLVVFFNENNTTALTITGVNITASGLGISNATNNFVNATADIGQSVSLLQTALSTLNTDAANFGGNATLIQTRQDFTNNLINSLQTASDQLVLADTNQEGANLQALQAQNQLGIVSLGISGQLEQAILRLF